MKFFFGKRKTEVTQTKADPPGIPPTEDLAEIAAVAAIALRLYIYKFEQREETLATIQKAIRPYSPWNSKIYNMKQIPHYRGASRIR